MASCMLMGIEPVLLGLISLRLKLPDELGFTLPRSKLPELLGIG
jgi:hypothetical protein